MFEVTSMQEFRSLKVSKHEKIVHHNSFGKAAGKDLKKRITNIFPLYPQSHSLSLEFVAPREM
mgnify:CR=1 FL=1